MWYANNIQVMSYVEGATEFIFRENSLHIKYSQAANTMGLDRSTITSLELLQNIRNNKGKGTTLFGLLNSALTPQGRRLIRSTLLQPSTSKEVIIARHEAVEELSSNEDLFTEIRKNLKKVFHIDVERSIPWVGDLRASSMQLSLVQMVLTLAFINRSGLKVVWNDSQSRMEWLQCMATIKF